MMMASVVTVVSYLVFKTVKTSSYYGTEVKSDEIGHLHTTASVIVIGNCIETG